MSIYKILKSKEGTETQITAYDIVPGMLASNYGLGRPEALESLRSISMRNSILLGPGVGFHLSKHGHISGVTW